MAGWKNVANAVHHTRHAAGGADVLTPADIGAVTLADVEAVVIDYLLAAEPGAVEPSLALFAHTQAPSPHPAYDDTPDLSLIFQNGIT